MYIAIFEELPVLARHFYRHLFNGHDSAICWYPRISQAISWHAYNYSCRWFSRVFETLKRELAATRKDFQLKLNWIKSVTVASSPSIRHFFSLDKSLRDYLYFEIEIFCEIDPHGCSFLPFQEEDQKMISSGIVAIYERKRWENRADVESYRKCSFDK